MSRSQKIKIKASAGFGPVNFDDVLTLTLDVNPMFPFRLDHGPVTLFFGEKEVARLRKFLKIK